jgi:hypothetical protein
MTSSYDEPGLIFWKNEENLITKEFRFKDRKKNNS